MSNADLENPDNQPTNTQATSGDALGGAGSPDGSRDTESAARDAAFGAASPGSLEEELQAANDRVLRAQAELENFRKRTRRELDDQRRYANFNLIGDLLPVLDNLTRAVEAAEQNDAASGLLEGVKMVSALMLSVLEQHGCRPIEADGVAFDPNLHEAIGKEPSEAAEGVVTRVTQAGYILHDRVVRPPQVLISAGPAAQD